MTSNFLQTFHAIHKTRDVPEIFYLHRSWCTFFVPTIWPLRFLQAISLKQAPSF